MTYIKCIATFNMTTLIDQKQKERDFDSCHSSSEVSLAGNPCGDKKPKPDKPDASYDTAGAISAIAEGTLILGQLFFRQM